MLPMSWQLESGLEQGHVGAGPAGAGLLQHLVPETAAF